MQTILIYILLAGAVFFIVRRTYRAVTRKEATGCENCGTADMNAPAHKKTVPGK